MQSSLSDNELVNQANQGEKDAFSILVERYRQKVFQTSMGFFHNTEEAEDLTQEIFVKAWHSLGSFDGRSSFSTWLYRISVNKALNQVRKNKLRAMTSIDNSREPAFDTGNADDHLMRQEQKEEIKKAIDGLKPKQKKAFILFYYLELNMKEVADVLNMSQKAAESLVFRARKKLQQTLSR